MCRTSVFPLILLVVVGCSGDSTHAVVSGTVTVDGQPMEKGTINFFPVDGKSQTTGGAVTDGKYSVKVCLGEMQVKISMPKVVGTKKLFDTPNSRERPILEEGLPERYNDESELKLEVTPGAVEKNWELKSK